ETNPAGHRVRQGALVQFSASLMDIEFEKPQMGIAISGGSSGCGVPRIPTSEPAAIQARSVNASPNCELGAQPNSRELGNEFGNKTRRNCRDGVERDVMAWT